MSDNLIIREDGVGRLIRGVDALEIKLQNGGTSRWVRFNPRDQKSVNANGEYHAKDDGVDGYRIITVNVPTRTKSQEPGRDQEIFNPDTGTGYYTDDDGLLHEELLPTEIRIMHVPDKTTYQDGEPIDLEGIVVQAYRGGEVWTSAKYPDGYIPVHELTLSDEEAPNRSKISSADLQWENDKLALTSYETYKGVNQVRKYDWYSVLDGKMRLCFYEVEGDEEYTYDNGKVALIASLKLEDEKEFWKIPGNATGWLKEHFVLDNPIGSQIKENTYGVFGREHISTKDGHFLGHSSEDYDAGVCWHAIHVAPMDNTNSYESNFPINKGLLNINNRYITAPNGERIYWAEYLAYIMHYDINGNMAKKISLLWSRPKDRKFLSTSFNIHMEAPS